MAITLEWHIEAPQEVLLERLRSYWWEQWCSTEEREGPQDGEAWVQFQNTVHPPPAGASLLDQVLVSATDRDGWAVVWPVHRFWNVELWMYLSWELHTPLLAGECNSVVDQSHWAWFEEGHLQAEHYTFSSGTSSAFHLNPKRQPTGEKSLNEAFGCFQRTFNASRLNLFGSKELLVTRS